jgi:hypothetical protein
MHRIRLILTISLLLAAVLSCITPFDPFIDSGEESKYVVTGCITDAAGYQSVYVSLASPIEQPYYRPLSGCQVMLADDTGNEFQMEEAEPGQYSTWMDEGSLQPGRAFRVTVNTPSGEILESDYDTLTECPPIDSVYYFIEDHPTSDPAVVNRGIQFYIDLDGIGFNSKYYRWEVVETWEYHSAHALEYYYDGGFNTVNPADSSNMYCWMTDTVNNIFTLSTVNLSQNEYTKFPLQFVDGKSSRLGILYSFQLRQYSLSEAAYTFWDNMRANSYEQGGLYEQQPMDIKGNVREMTGTGREVLGFFQASSVRVIRMFVKDVEGLDLDFKNYCNEESLGRFGWREFSPKDYPVYYYFNPAGSLRILSKECIECERLGGTMVKPEFWPE